LLADPTIASIASLSSRAFKEQDLAPQDQPGTLKRLPQGERFLVFQAGRPIAVPLSQVTCILQPPRVIVPVTEAVNGLVGYFARLRDSVLLVDLNSFLGVPLQSSEFCRVLLTGEQDHQVGFRVERVHSIETSTWLLQGWTREGPGSEPLVQLGLGAARQALPVVDLMRIADDLFGLTPNSGIV
jgi:chemotaxis signal transduction protein